MEGHFDISEFISSVFYNAFYQLLGRKRDYPLTGFLSAIILQKIFPIPTDSLLILNFMSPKIIPKPSIPFSAASRLTIKTILMLTLIRWLTVSCLHRLLPVLTQNSSISMAISTMLINLPSSLTVSALSAISPFPMMLLRPPIQKYLWKRNPIPQMKINPSVIPPP